MRAGGAEGRIEVRPVTSPCTERAFRLLPHRLYRYDRCWIPPLRGEERRRWCPARNPSLRPRWTARFVGYRNGVPVGRVAAIDDPAFASRWEPGAGLFGFFESVDDPAVAHALLGSAEACLGARGLRRSIGPVNLTFHDETGVLVDGFDSPPMVLSPYNPPFYPRLLEWAGYRPLRDYVAYQGSPETVPAETVRRIEARMSQGAPTQRVTVRPLDPARWEAESRLVWRLYSTCFQDVWGSTPMTWEEFADRAGRLRRVVRPELTLFAERGGEPIGFALTLPDLNRALAACGGRLWPLGWLRLRRELQRSRAARFTLLGVRPDRTGGGAAALLAYRTALACRSLGIDRLELSLVLAGNVRVERIITAFGGRPLKRYRLYEKAIALLPEATR